MKLLEWIKGNEPEVIDEEEVLHTNMRPVIIFGFAVLIFGFFGFITWAALAPMINGINMPGTVSSASHEDIIQSRYGGTIQKILVKEGAVVKKNQPIVLLQDGQLKSNLASSKSQYITFLAMYGRLKAEASGAKSIKFPNALLNFRHSAHAVDAISTQRELFISDTADYDAEKNILKTDITGLKHYIASAKELKKSLAEQVSLAKKETLPLEKLAKSGYYPKTKVIALKSNLESLEGRYNEETGNIARFQSSLIQTQMKLSDLRNRFLKNVNRELNEVQSKVFALKEQYGAALGQYKNSRISSPSDGVVVKIFNKTVGGAIMPGQPIVDILPIHQSLIIKGDIPVQDIAHIKKGLEANLRFPDFNVENTPVLNGRVIYVSANSLANPANHMSFYICRIKINADGLKTLARRNLKLKAGMPVEITVKTGAETLLGAILNPLLYKISNTFVK
jgi:HlyD family type I secretion membrane fusion protein